MYNGPAKSSPVEVNGESILTRKSGSGGGTGAEWGLPSNLLHTRHLWRIRFTSDLPLSIQYFAWSSVRVPFMSLWKTLACALSTNNSVIWWYLGRRMACLVRHIGIWQSSTTPPDSFRIYVYLLLESNAVLLLSWCSRSSQIRVVTVLFSCSCQQQSWQEFQSWNILWLQVIDSCLQGKKFHMEFFLSLHSQIDHTSISLPWGITEPNQSTSPLDGGCHTAGTLGHRFVDQLVSQSS